MPSDLTARSPCSCAANGANAASWPSIIALHTVFSERHLSFARFASVVRPFTPKAENLPRHHMGLLDEVRGVFRA